MWLLDPKSFNAQNVAAGGKINFIKEQEKKKKKKCRSSHHKHNHPSHTRQETGSLAPTQGWEFKYKRSSLFQNISTCNCMIVQSKTPRTLELLLLEFSMEVAKKPRTHHLSSI